MQDAHDGAEIRARTQPKFSALDQRAGIDDVLHRIIRREHAGRVFDFARRIEFEDCEARKHCDGNRSKAHGGGS
jgi:hypothetical protein